MGEKYFHPLFKKVVKNIFHPLFVVCHFVCLSKEGEKYFSPFFKKWVKNIFHPFFFPVEKFS